MTGASLDHAMWFHGPFRADQWLLYVQESPVATGARGLALGQIFQDGRLIASVVQEGLIRVDLAHPPAGLDTSGCLPQICSAD